MMLSHLDGPLRCVAGVIPWWCGYRTVNVFALAHPSWEDDFGRVEDDNHRAPDSVRSDDRAGCGGTSGVDVVLTDCSNSCRLLLYSQLTLSSCSRTGIKLIYPPGTANHGKLFTALGMLQICNKIGSAYSIGTETAASLQHKLTYI